MKAEACWTWIFAEYIFREDDILVIIGKGENIRKFEKEKEE